MNDTEKNTLAAELADAVWHGRADAVRKLLSSGADPNAMPAHGWHPVLSHIRYWVDDVEILRLLLAAGAEVNPLHVDRSPLGYALADYEETREPLEAVELLLQAGANPNAPGGYWDEYPLHTAAARGFVDVIRLLLAYGADPQVQDDFHRTPLDYAREAGQGPCACLLEMLTTTDIPPTPARP